MIPPRSPMFCNCIFYGGKSNKRPMGHIAHLRNQFKSINTYDYIITLIKRRKKTIINFMRINWYFIWTNLNLLHPRILCTKFGWNLHSGSGEDENVKSLQTDRRTDRQTDRRTDRRRTTGDQKSSLELSAQVS